MKKYIFGERNGIYIINLEQTTEMLEKACEAVNLLASKGKNVVLRSHPSQDNFFGLKSKSFFPAIFSNIRSILMILLHKDHNSL